MKEPLARLTERTQLLGNYNRKYLHIISTNIDELIGALEKKGRRDRVHLFSYSMEIPGEMDTVIEVAGSEQQRGEPGSRVSIALPPGFALAGDERVEVYRVDGAGRPPPGAAMTARLGAARQRIVSAQKGLRPRLNRLLGPLPPCRPGGEDSFSPPGGRLRGGHPADPPLVRPALPPAAGAAADRPGGTAEKYPRQAGQAGQLGAAAGDFHPGSGQLPAAA